MQLYPRREECGKSLWREREVKRDRAQELEGVQGRESSRIRESTRERGQELERAQEKESSRIRESTRERESSRIRESTRAKPHRGLLVIMKKCRCRLWGFSYLWFLSILISLKICNIFLVCSCPSCTEDNLIIN